MKTLLLLFGVPSLLLSGCDPSRPVAPEPGSYAYTGQVTGENIVIDSIQDSTICRVTETLIRDTTGMQPDHVLKSNTCDLDGVLRETFRHFRPNIVRTDTLESVAQRRYKVRTFVEIAWSKPVLDSAWIKELTATRPFGTHMTWFGNRVRLIRHSVDLTDSIKVPASMRAEILFDYVLKFTRVSTP